MSSVVLGRWWNPVWSGADQPKLSPPDPVWSGADQPELSPPDPVWSGAELKPTWCSHPAGPGSSSHLSLVLKNCWAPSSPQSEADGWMNSLTFLTPHVPVCFHTPFPHVCHLLTSLTNLTTSLSSLLLPVAPPSPGFEPLLWRSVFLSLYSEGVSFCPQSVQC